MSRKPNPNVEIFEEATSDDVITEVENGACVKHTWENASGNIQSPTIELRKDGMTLKYEFTGPNGVSEYEDAKDELSEMNDVLCE